MCRTSASFRGKWFARTAWNPVAIRLMNAKTHLVPDQALDALVDRLLLEQGQLDPFELLIAADLLAYEDYEAWRTGRRPELQGALHAAPEQVVGILDRAGSYARRQKLADIALTQKAWGGHDSPLSVGTHQGLNRACGIAYAPHPDRQQLDLFHDSTALLLEDEIRCALAERRTDRAREQIVRLMQQDPAHPRLRSFLRLMQAIDESDVPDLRRSPEDRAAELEDVEPLARQVLGHRARDFLAALWADVAERLVGRRFDRARPGLHAAVAWARAGRWEAAREGVEAEPNWRDQPALVLIHADAVWHRRDPAAARRDWLWLCWEFPTEAERAFGSGAFADRRLGDLWNGFGDLDEALETEDFPAWLLIRDPDGFAMVSPDSAPADERGDAFRVLHRMVAGGDAIELRRELGEVHPKLLRLFLARKEKSL
jgi:hypothetical protein